MTDITTSPSIPAPGNDAEESAFRLIRDALRGLQFGSVTIIIQDSVVVQVERTEKKRISRKRQAD